MPTKPKPKPERVTDAMILDATPAVYRGFRLNRATGEMKFICWPGVKFPGKREVIVLEKRQCRSQEEAISRARTRLDRERRKVLAPTKRKAKP